MPKTVIRAVEFADGSLCPHKGQYLKWFDFEAYEGKGYGAFSPDIDEAKRFASKEAALDYWKTISKTRPRRRDGQPNRPMTCLTIELVEVDK